MRRTGRTTRMLKQALSKSFLHSRVYIIVYSFSHKRELEYILNEISFIAFNKPYRKVASNIEFINYDSPMLRVNWLNLNTSRIMGHTGAVVLYDHYTVESYCESYVSKVMEGYKEYESLGSISPYMED